MDEPGRERRLLSWICGGLSGLRDVAGLNVQNAACVCLRDRNHYAYICFHGDLSAVLCGLTSGDLIKGWVCHSWDDQKCKKYIISQPDSLLILTYSSCIY